MPRIERGVMKYIVSVSFGKDSLAMLLKLLENNMPVDEAIFFDTGMEFNCIYSIMHTVKHTLEERGIEFTRLKADKEFLNLMLDHKIQHRNGTTSCGYRWCGGNCRWYTTYKTSTIRKYLGNKYGGHTFYMEYVGIAFDETKRIERNSDKLLPLVDWHMTERDCLEYCHSKGFYWMEGEHELYDDLDRVSCWCCRNKNLKELKQIYLHHKVYWLALCELERRCGMTMKKDTSLSELEQKWKLEESNKQMSFDDLLWNSHEGNDDGKENKTQNNAR